MRVRLQFICCWAFLNSLSLVMGAERLSDDPYDHLSRGDQYLWEGQIEEAIERYNHAVRLRPGLDPHLWQRGIAYYYARRFTEGVGQFERHRQVNPHDVENAAWHFLCMARATNVTRARRALIPVQGDARVPMKEVHEMFAGTLEPEAVITAAAGQRRALCYAHQYVGLYFEVLGRPDRAQQHMALAAETYAMPSYMGKIAQLHLRRMRAHRAVTHMPKGAPYAILRGGLANARITFARQKRGRIAFLGGSITQADGWRQMVERLLKKRFSETDFEYVAAGLASTDSTTGAFRLATDVLSRGKIDLLFVEFAVNDNQDSALSTTASIRGMEGIVRQVRRHNPNADIIFTHFPNGSHLEDYRGGIIPDEIMSHEQVAQYYQIPSIHLAREVADALRAGSYTFKTYGGVHPNAFGQQIYAARVGVLFEKAWPGELAEEAMVRPHAMPGALIDDWSFVRGRYLHRSAVTPGRWLMGMPDWGEKPGHLRPFFKGLACMHTETPRVPLKAAFTGSAIGVYVLAGPDAGILEYSIDGRAFADLDLYHRHSTGLHYPRTVMFDAELEQGAHEIVIRLAEQHGERSRGPAARILQLVAN